MALHEGSAGRRLQVALALGTVYVVWGSTYLAIRFAIETIPPMLMAGVRFLLSGALLYVLARARGAERPLAVHWRSAAVVGGLLLVAGNGIVVWAEQWVSSGLTALLVSTTPLWMVLLHWWSRDGSRPSLRTWGGIAVGFAGVGLLVNPGGTGGGGVSLGGAALLVLASFCWASGSLYSRRAPLPSSPLLATGLEMLIGGALLLLIGLATGETARVDLAATSAASLAAFAYLVVFGTLGFTAYIWVLKAAPPALVSTYAYVNPLVAVLLGWALAGEEVTGRTLLGALVIVSGVALITASGQKRAPEEEPARAGEPLRRSPEPAGASTRSLEPVGPAVRHPGPAGSAAHGNPELEVEEEEEEALAS